jgi:predicted nucleic acid-binding protein
VLFDSTIVIDFLNQIPGAATALRTTERPAVSVITWIEVLAGARTPAAEEAARALLATFDVLSLTADIAESTIVLRRESRLKMPDAIILATAKCHGLTLATRNTKDFDPADPGIVVPYRL